MAFLCFISDAFRGGMISGVNLQQRKSDCGLPVSKERKGEVVVNRKLKNYKKKYTK